jgi:hypothetical protein
MYTRLAIHPLDACTKDEEMDKPNGDEDEDEDEDVDEPKPKDTDRTSKRANNKSPKKGVYLW